MDRHVYVTPTFRGDAARFAFQRESMLALGITTPHLAIVDREDLAIVRRAVPAEGLEIVSSRDVLAPSIERLRRVGRLRWGRALPTRLRIAGWMAQQLMKLAVVDRLDAPTAVTLDSDAFFLNRPPDDVYAAIGGRPVVHEFVDLPAGSQPRRYLRTSEAVLGLPSGTADDRVSYVSVAVPLDVALVRALRAHLDDRHGSWARAMNAHGATEYTTYGLFARHVQRDVEVEALDRRQCAAFFRFEPEVFATEIAAAAADPSVHLGMVHSRLGVPLEAITTIVRGLWSAPRGAATWQPPRGVPYGRI